MVCVEYYWNLLSQVFIHDAKIYVYYMSVKKPVHCILNKSNNSHMDHVVLPFDELDLHSHSKDIMR